MKTRYFALSSVIVILFAFLGLENSLLGQSTYNLITNTNELVVGEKYLIVATNSGNWYAMGWQNTNNRPATLISVSQNSTTTSVSVINSDQINPYEVTLGGSSGAWTLYDAINNTYLKPRTGNSNGLQGQAGTTNATWQISFGANDNAVMTCENTTTYPRNILRFNQNGSSPLFACYASGQSDVFLYKIAGTTPLSAPVLDAPFSYNGTVGVSFAETPNNIGGAAQANGWSVDPLTPLPTGLSIDPDTGEITGTPTVDGTFYVDITVENSVDVDTETYTFTIAPAPVGGTPCFSEDFSDITNGDNTTTGGNSAAWNGNANFPTVDRTYQAGGVVKIGVSGNPGSIESKVLNDVSGDITVNIMVKGWTTIEGDLKISIDGQSETKTYNAVMADPFEEVTASFTGVTAGAKLKIETTAKRAFIDEVEILCGAPDAPDLSDETFYGTVGVSFSETPSNNGGPGTSWSIVSGSFPAGVDLDEDTGEISGVPEISGTYSNIKIKAENDGGDDEATYTIIISPNPPSLTNEIFYGFIGLPFSETPTNSGGGSTSWSVVGSAPAWLSLNSTTGELTGTPLVEDTYQVELKASNNNGNSSSTATYTIIISEPPYECIDIDEFTGLPAGWIGSSVTYTNGEAVFGSNSGDLTTVVISNPVSLEFDLRRTTNTSAKTLYVEISTTSQSSGFTIVETYDHSNVSSGTTPISIDLSAFSNETVVYVRFRKFSSTTAPWYIKNLKVICEPCISLIELTEIRPSAAPALAKVQIEVNDASLIDQVKWSNAPISFETIDAQTIEVEVPSNAEPGLHTISLVELSECSEDVVFEVLQLIGNCAIMPETFDDLFMSEIYDAEVNNEWYVELYNPTDNPIVLDNVYQIKKAPIGQAYNRTVDLEGTVPPHSVFMLHLSSSATTCTNVSFDFYESGPGISNSYRVSLFKNNALVDDVESPNNSGYTLKRKIENGVIAPSDTFDEDDWDINSTESCVDLGNVTVINPPDLISPNDALGCDISFSVSTTTSGVTYQWYFNDPATISDWLEVNSSNLSSYSLSISGEETNELEITGNDVALLDGFQFYCEVMDDECGIISNTARYSHGGAPFYRSIDDGVWTNPSNWEVAMQIIGPWSPACDYPTAANSEMVFIEENTKIDLDVDMSINYVEIKEGGTLETEPDSELSINNENLGADFIVDGTFIYRSNSANSVSLDNGATWILGSDGTIVKTNTGSSTTLRDNYEGGISNIPATAYWIYRYNGDGNPHITAVDMFYPNLFFENVTGSSYTTNTSEASFQGITGGFTTIKGDLKIGVSGTSPYIVRNVNSYSSPMLVIGDVEIALGSGLVNDFLPSFPGNTVEGTGMEIKGDLTVNGTLDISHGVGERVLMFSGDNVQTVSGSGTIDVYKIEINKSNEDIILNRNLQAQGELKMVNGNVLTTDYYLELGLNSSQVGTLNYTEGFIVGAMKRWFNGINSGDAASLFPLGWEGNDPVPVSPGIKNRFAKIEFSTSPSSGGSLTTMYIPQDMGYDGLVILMENTGGFDGDVINAENQGYWAVNAGDGLSGGIYKASFTGEGFEQIESLNDITLLKRDNSSSPWTAPGQHLTPSGTIEMPTVQRDGLSGFSDFGFGSSNLNSPLPIELLNFDLSCMGNEISISWSTASEKNNEKFIVEKLNENLKEWEEVEIVSGSGNSFRQVDYQIFDKSRNGNNASYYRLTQVDFDGRSEVFPTKSIVCRMEDELTIYPNPTYNYLTVEGSFLGLGTTIMLYDLTGKVVKSETIDSASHYALTLDVSKIMKGLYLVTVLNKKGEKRVEKIEVR